MDPSPYASILCISLEASATLRNIDMQSNSTRTVLLGFFLLAVNAASAAALALAQDRISVSPATVCVACEIQVEVSVTLGGPTEEEGLICARGPLSVVSDDSGSIYVGPSCDRHRFLRFGADGRLLGSYGRRGQGPGEIQEIGRLHVGSNDRLHVYDWQRRRVILESDRQTFQMTPIQQVPRYVVDGPDGTTIENFLIASPGRAGLPIHVVDRSGALVRSFGSEHRRYRYDQPTSQWRALTGSRSGGVWAAHYNNYRLEEWDPTTGTLKRSLTRDVRWFAPWDDRDESAETPQPALSSVREDADGMLWVLISVPDPRRGSVSQADPEPWHQRLDSIIEVIDPEAGQVVAAGRFDQLFGRWVGDRLTILRETKGGDRYLELWSARRSE